MSRYDLTTGVEGEYEPGSRGRVLMNRMGIKSLSLMHNIEDQALERFENVYFESGTITAETRFNAELIGQMHRDWLCEILRMGRSLPDC
jgi:hypothetical protein